MERMISFYECEHAGDLSNYADDLYKSGATIVSQSLNDEAETGRIYITVDDFAEFIEKFKQTPSYGFSNLKFV